MTVPTKIYDAKMLAKIADFYSKFTALVEEFEGDAGAPLSEDNPLYIWSGEIVFRHRDDYTIGRFGLDDFWFFEITDEDYGDPKAAAKDSS